MNFCRIRQFGSAVYEVLEAMYANEYEFGVPETVQEFCAYGVVFVCAWAVLFVVWICLVPLMLFFPGGN